MSDPRTKYHVHDCPSCRYLGSYIHDALMGDPDSEEHPTWREPTHMDLYRCGRTYLARYGSEPWEYASGLRDSVRSVPEAESTYGPALRKAADMDDARCPLYGEL